MADGADSFADSISQSQNPADLVKRGYNEMASRYLAARLRGTPDPPLLAEFSGLLSPNAMVLDAGCGAGIPATRSFAQRHRVVGIDFSLAQVRLAARFARPARIACVDMTQLAFPPGTFDGVCSLYAILHIPRFMHRDLLEGFYRLLREGGLALLCLGDKDAEAEYGPYFGKRMYWSHFDGREYLRLLEATGFQVVSHEAHPDPISKIATHLFVLARKGIC